MMAAAASPVQRGNWRWVHGDLIHVECTRWREADLGPARRRGPRDRSGAGRRPPGPLPGCRAFASAADDARPSPARRRSARVPDLLGAGPQGRRRRRPGRPVEHRAGAARRRRRADHRVLAAGAHLRRRARHGHRTPPATSARSPPPTASGCSSSPSDRHGRARCSRSLSCWPAPSSSPRSSTSPTASPARRRGPAPARAAQRRAGVAARRPRPPAHGGDDRPVASVAARGARHESDVA